MYRGKAMINDHWSDLLFFNILAVEIKCYSMV